MTSVQGPRRRWLGWMGVGAWAALAAGCGVLGGGRPSIRVSRDRIQQKLNNQFPRDQRLMELLDVHMEVPMVDLLSGKVLLRMPVQVGERFSGQVLQGMLSFTTVPRWDARDQTIRMSQVRTTELTLVNDSGASPSWLQRLGSVVAERLLNDLPVYRLSAEQSSQLQRYGWHPSAVRVTTEVVELVLVSDDDEE